MISEELRSEIISALGERVCCIDTRIVDVDIWKEDSISDDVYFIHVITISENHVCFKYLYTYEDGMLRYSNCAGML